MSNPYRDPGPWGRVQIGTTVLPGVVLDIDGAERPDQWDVQKATEKSGASTVWKGTGIAETIKITLALHDEETFDEYERVRRVLRPKLGTQPPALPITNPSINWAEITRVSCRNVAYPRWVAPDGYWRGVIELIDYSPPKPAKTGVARPQGAGGGGPGQGAGVDPNADLRRQRDGLLATAKFLASGGRVPQEGN